MPWASQAQRRLFYARPELHKYIAEFNAATPKGAKLPEHAQQKSNLDRLASALARSRQDG